MKQTRKKFPAIRKQYYPVDGTEYTDKPEGARVCFLQLKNKTFSNWVIGLYDMEMGKNGLLNFSYYIQSVPNEVTDKEVEKKSKRLGKFLQSVLYDIVIVTAEYHAEKEAKAHKEAQAK